MLDWCTRAIPTQASAIRPPTPSEVLATAMTDTGCDWPEALCEWFGLHDGVDAETWFPLLGGFRPLPLAEVLDARRMHLQIWAQLLAQPEDPAAVRKRVALGGPERDPRRDVAHLDAQPAGTVAGMFLPSYIPIGGWDAHYLFVDSRPGPLHGCVTEYAREDTDSWGPRWPSLDAMLGELADSLEQHSPAAGRLPIVENGTLDWEVILDAHAEAALAKWRATQNPG